MSDAPALPPDLLAWVEATAGGTLSSAARVPGGGRRQAWFVDIAREYFVTCPTVMDVINDPACDRARDDADG